MNRFVLAGAVAITMLSGFAYAQSPASTTMTHGHSGNSMAACPMTVPGAQVSASSTTTGETLTFSTNTPAQVAELRRRVHAAAEMHNKNHASGGTHGDMMGDEMMGGMMGSNHMMGTAAGTGHMAGGTMMPQSHATVADVDKGACITLTPSTATDLKQLQSAMGAAGSVVLVVHLGCGPLSQN
jgi:hypothetical protein